MKGPQRTRWRHNVTTNSRGLSPGTRVFTEELSATAPIRLRDLRGLRAMLSPIGVFVTRKPRCPLSSQMKHADQADDNEIDRDDEIEQTRDDQN
jgi:hypothetical protein